MTGRAVLLPTPGNNPFLVAHWLQNFQTWRHLVDTLYVDVSWPVDEAVRERIAADVIAAGGTPTVNEGPRLRTHGMSLHHMLDRCKEDIVLLMEDDLYVRRPEAIEHEFRRIESGEVDIAGEARGSMSVDLYLECERVFGGGKEHGLWPHTLFTRAEVLRQAGNMDAWHWQAGEEVPGLGGYVATGETCADTFGPAAINLAGQGFSIYRHKKDYQDPPWFHIGSLSSGPILQHDENDHAHFFNEVLPQSLPSYRDRCSWWKRVLRCWPGGLDEFRAVYERDLMRIIGGVGEANVNLSDLHFNRLVNWPE